MKKSNTKIMKNTKAIKEGILLAIQQYSRLSWFQNAFFTMNKIDKGA
jgi:hypothetical protein